VSQFLENARRILDTATSAAGTGEGTRFSILIGPAGEIRMVADSDWPLDNLAAEHGARMAYRVSGSGDRVRVEGRSGGQRCLLENESPGAVARRLLRDTPRYWLAPPALPAP
jgi:hypothetical protein